MLAYVSASSGTVVVRHEVKNGSVRFSNDPNRLPGSLSWPPSDPLLDPPSKVTPFVLTALHRTATFRSDRARVPFWVSACHLVFSECCCACGVARISLGIRLCVRRRCVSIFHLFLTFLKRACSPGAVKNSKI